MRNQSSKYILESNLLKYAIQQHSVSRKLPQEVIVVINRQAESLEYANLICDHLLAIHILDDLTRKNRAWTKEFGFKGSINNMQKYIADVYETRTRLDKYERLHLVRGY